MYRDHFTKYVLQAGVQIHRAREGYRLVGLVEGDSEVEALGALKPGKKLIYFESQKVFRIDFFPGGLDMMSDTIFSV